MNPCNLIYPGPGQSSPIGFEKSGNKNVTPDKMIWESMGRRAAVVDYAARPEI
jgi:hypothetical protein